VLSARAALSATTRQAGDESHDAAHALHRRYSCLGRPKPLARKWPSGKPQRVMRSEGCDAVSRSSAYLPTRVLPFTGRRMVGATSYGTLSCSSPRVACDNSSTISCPRPLAIGATMISPCIYDLRAILPGRVTAQTAPLLSQGSVSCSSTHSAHGGRSACLNAAVPRRGNGSPANSH